MRSKIPFYFQLICIVVTLAFACKKKEPSFNDTPLANAQYNNSNYGIYKGVIVGSSGTIIIDLNNNQSISATMIIDYVTYRFTTSQSVRQGINTTLNFTSGSNSFRFTVSSNGTNPTISSIYINGHPNAAIIIVKETSNSLVRCYEGSYSGDDYGIFNAIIYNNSIRAIIKSNTGYYYTANGTVLNNQINLSGNVGYTANFTGLLRNNNFSGTWISNSNNAHGNWLGNRSL